MEITNIFYLPIETRNVRHHRKEDYFIEALIAVLPHRPEDQFPWAQRVIEARWYHKKQSPRWDCCVWINLHLPSPDDPKGFYASGGGKAQVQYSGNAKHRSLNDALKSAGFLFTDEQIGDGDQIETYFLQVVQALLQYESEKTGQPVRQFSIVGAHA